MSFIEQLTWREATKIFDPKNKVSEADFQTVVRAAVQAPTSYGLQPFQILVVTNPALRSRLRQASFNQPQITDASHLLVWATRHDLTKRITDYIDLACASHKLPPDGLKQYEMIMRGALGKLSTDQTAAWCQRQAYLSLGFALAACAELKVDSCPMEGLSTTDYDKLLAVPEGQATCVVLAIGCRAKSSESLPKIRFAMKDLIKTYA